MAIVKYDSDKLDGLRPSINEVINNLKAINNAIGALSIPGDFDNRGSLSTIVAKFNSDVSKLDNYCRWIDKCKIQFMAVESEYGYAISKLRVEHIKKREKLN